MKFLLPDPAGGRPVRASAALISFSFFTLDGVFYELQLELAHFLGEFSRCRRNIYGYIVFRARLDFANGAQCVADGSRSRRIDRHRSHSAEPERRSLCQRLY